MDHPFHDGIRQYFSAGQLARLRAARVGIAGAGGLGSNAALCLARCGFEHFVLVDFDRVEPSNLNRQFYFEHQVGRPKVDALRDNLRAINAAIEVDARVLRLEAGNSRDVFAACDVLVEAFDDPEAKAMLYTAFAGDGRLLVMASGLAGSGDADAVVTRRLRPGVYVVGDGCSAVGADRPPLAPRVMTAAAKQAAVVLSHILEGTA